MALILYVNSHNMIVSVCWLDLKLANVVCQLSFNFSGYGDIIEHLYTYTLVARPWRQQWLYFLKHILIYSIM